MLHCSLVSYVIDPDSTICPLGQPLIMSKDDHPTSTNRQQIQTQWLLVDEEGLHHKSQPNALKPPKLITTYEQIKQHYPNILKA